MLFAAAFEDVSDPREFNAQHDLTEILFVALSALLCGAKSCTEMAQFGRSRLDLLRQFIPLEHGVPSHDTFSRVFRLLDPKQFNAAFVRFMAAFGQQARLGAAKGVIAVDGKSLRGAYDKGRAHMPKLVASVFACDTFMTLAQAVAERGGERAAAIEALKLLSLQDCVVTGDALHCNRPMVQAVRGAGGDYALAIKANQSNLMKQATAALDAADPKAPVHETRGSSPWPPGDPARRRRPLRPEPRQDRPGRPSRCRPRGGLAHARGKDRLQGSPIRPIEDHALRRPHGHRAKPLENRKQPPLGPRRPVPRGRRPKPKRPRASKSRHAPATGRRCAPSPPKQGLSQHQNAARGLGAKLPNRDDNSYAIALPCGGRWPAEPAG